MYKQCLMLLVVFSTINSFVPKTNPIGDDVKKNVYKCCDNNHYLGRRKKCIKDNITMSFSQMKVYHDITYEYTGKSVNDVFDIIPNRFQNSSLFKNNCMNVKLMKYIERITESGVLTIDRPNTYDRYLKLPVANYCIDYSYSSGNIVLEYRVVLPKEEEQQRNRITFITYGAMMISCFFMMLVLLVFSLLKRLRNLPGLILMAYVSSLFMAFILLIIIQVKIHSPTNCLVLTLGIYYFFMAAFCWMTVMSFDIWWGIRHPLRISISERINKKISRFLKYCLWAFGIPLSLTIFLAVVNEVDMRSYPWFVTPGLPENGCFLSGYVKMLYLYLPMLILILCNWMFFVMTMMNVWCHHQQTDVLDTAAAGNRQEHRKLKNKLILYFKLYVVMGLNWLLEIISFMYPDADTLWQITDFSNIFVGVSIFIIFVCKKKVLNESKRFVGAKFRGWHSSFTNMRNKEANQNISMSVRTSTSQPNHQNGYRAVSQTA